MAALTAPTSPVEWPGGHSQPPGGIRSSCSRSAAGIAAPHVPSETSVDVTQLFSLRENAIAKEPGLVILSPGGVCLDSGWRMVA